MSFWVKTNYFIKKIFPNYVWDISNNENKVFLTFDDGPIPEITEWTLEQLKKYDANIIFSSAIFLLFNTGVVKIFEQYWKEVPLDKAVAMLEKLDKEKLLDM